MRRRVLSNPRFASMRRSSARRIARLAFASLLSAMLTSSVQAQSWSGTTSGAWLTTTNWTGGVAAGSTTVGDTDIAVFNVAANPTIGINMSTTGGVYHLGAIDNTNATARTFNNSSTTAPGVLTLNGATVNAVANTILRNSTTTAMTITNGTLAGTLGLELGNATNNIIQITGTGGITIGSAISGAGRNLTLQGGGTGALSLSGVNTYTGTTNINAGTLVLSNANPLGTIPGTDGTSGITMAGASILQANVTGVTVAAPITLSGVANSTIRAGVTAGSTTNINGAIGGATGNVIYTTTTGSFSNAPSNFVLGAAGTYTGNTQITTGNGSNNPVLVRAGAGVVNALPTSTVLSFAGVAGGGTGRFFQYDMFGNDQTLAGLTNTVASLRRQTFTNTGALATLTINNTTDMSFGGSDLTTGSTNRAQITGAINLTKSGTGTFTLGGTLAGGATAGGNTHTGATRVTGGILVLGETLSLQNSAFDTTGSVVGDATNGLRTTPTTLTLGGLTGNKNFSDVFTTTTGGYSGLTAVTLNPGTGVTNSYDGNIGNGAGAMTLTKTGAGTQILNGANTYTGNTTISAGTLTLGTSGTISSSPLVDVLGGATFDVTAGGLALGANTLRGSGTVLGAVTASSGATITGGNGTTGTLTAGSLTFGGTGTVNVGTLSGYTTTAAVNVTNALTLSGGPSSITVNTPTASVASGAYRLIQFGSGISDVSGFALGTTPALTARQTGTTLGLDSGFVTLTVAGTPVVWTGGVSSEWSTNVIASPKNWGLPAETDFLAGDDVFFTDAAVLKTVDISVAAVAPTTATFNNSTGNDYTVTGTSGITGGAIVTKNNTGTVIINNANTYSGATNLNAGTIQLGNAGALGSGTINLAGGTLRYGAGITTDLSARFSTAASQAYKIDTNGNDVTLATALSSVGGALTKDGTGNLTLTANNALAGGVTVTAGTLTATKNAATTNALGTGAVSIASGSTVAINVAKTTNIADTVSNTFTGSGTLRVNFASGATARNTFFTNGLAGFNGNIDLVALGATGDRFSVNTLGALNPSLSVNTGTTLFVQTGDTTFSGGITINGAGNAENRGAIRLNGATAVLGGNISLAGSSTISSDTVGGQVTGNISSSVAGPVTLTLGSTGALGGTLSGAISNGSGTVAITQAVGANTLSGALSHTGGISVTGGTVTLSNANNTYSGATAISSGLVNVSADGALGATGAGNETTIAGTPNTTGPYLRFSGGINYTATEKVIGAGSGDNRGFIQSGSGNNTFAGDIELSANGNSRIGTQDGAQLTLTGAITQGTGITTANVLFRTGSNTGDFVTLSNAGNSFGGDSTVFNAATGVAGNYAGVRLGVTNALPTNLSISGFSGAGAGTALDLNGKDQTLNGLVTGGGGNLRIINQDTVTASTLTLNPTADQTTTATTILGDGGLGVINVVKNGTFTQTLGGVNTYTGSTNVTSGALVAGSAQAFGANSATTVDGTLRLAGNSNSIGSLAGSATGIVENASVTAATLTTGGDNTSTVFSGLIQNGTGGGALSLVKTGTGTQTISGANTFSGATVINGGILLANSVGALGSGGVTVNAGTLGGTGGVVTGGVTLAGGTIAPGSSIGTLGVGSVGGAGTLGIEYDTSTQTIDVLNVAGALDITSIALNFSDFAAVPTSLTQPAYVFATYGSLVGSNFTSISGLPATYSVDYNYLSGSQIALVAVPEPGTLALLTVAIVGGGLYRRSRNQKKSSATA